MRMTAVEAIIFEADCVVLDDGGVLRIEAILDADGEECAPSEAFTILAGNEEAGWFTLPYDQRLAATLH